MLSALFAVPIAWGVSRTDMPAKGLVRALILGAFITPPYLGAIGWILLAGPNAGWLNKRVDGADRQSQRLHQRLQLRRSRPRSRRCMPFPTSSCSRRDALDRVSSEMEEAANILGAGGFYTIFRITLPLVTPAILGGAIVVFLDTVALFGTPGDHRAAGAHPDHDAADLAVSSNSRCEPEVAAAYAIPLIADHSRAVLGAAPGPRPQGLRGADRQGRQPAR